MMSLSLSLVPLLPWRYQRCSALGRVADIESLERNLVPGCGLVGAVELEVPDAARAAPAELARGVAIVHTRRRGAPETKEGRALPCHLCFGFAAGHVTKDLTLFVFLVSLLVTHIGSDLSFWPCFIDRHPTQHPRSPKLNFSHG